MLSLCGLLLASLCSFGSAPGGCPVDASKLVVLPPGDQVTWRQGLSVSEYPLAQSDIEAAECLLLPQVEAWNKEMAEGGSGDHIEPSDYFRQYCVMRDGEGHRVVFLNAFCPQAASKALWKQNWVEVDDGGSCYFQSLIDLTTGRVVEFNVNGEA